METVRVPAVNPRQNHLASNSWSVWMETKRERSSTLKIISLLLPIREAYEWKQKTNISYVACAFLLPIREAYEWKRRAIIHYNSFAFTCFQFVKRMNGNISIKPTRLAGRSSCFQFVKRMNGNLSHPLLAIHPAMERLASNSWSVWMETKVTQ